MGPTPNQQWEKSLLTLQDGIASQVREVYSGHCFPSLLFNILPTLPAAQSICQTVIIFTEQLPDSGIKSSMGISMVWGDVLP